MASPLALEARTLHWVLKIGNREKTINFFKSVLGMKVLRHEEFKEGCEAMCNGPYDGQWSKTMIGYGPEDKHFVLELTYNYGIGKYKLGNDLMGISVNEKKDLNEIYKSAKENELASEKIDSRLNVKSPDGYMFVVSQDEKKIPDVTEVSLAVTSLEKSLKFWRDTLGMTVMKQQDNDAVIYFGDENQAKLCLKQLEEGSLDHATASGRIAFSVPGKQLEPIRNRVKTDFGNDAIIKDLVELETEGKATVKVVILDDPDGYEICFVGDEEYVELSKFDPKADELLEEAMKNDKSDEWFMKKKGGKPVEG